MILESSDEKAGIPLEWNPQPTGVPDLSQVCVHVVKTTCDLSGSKKSRATVPVNGSCIGFGAGHAAFLRFLI